MDGASLAAFRVLFGAVMLALVLRFVAKGWVTTQLTGPSYHFTYEPFLFVRPWPALGMQLHFAILAIAAACIALGFFHRTSAAVFFVAAVGVPAVFFVGTRLGLAFFDAVI